MPRNVKQVRSKEEAIRKALDDVRNNRIKNLNAAARAHGVSRSTLADRLQGRQSHTSAAKKLQSLTDNEERTLVHHVTYCSKAGFPVTPRLAIEMAELIRSERRQLKAGPRPVFPPLSRNWFAAFKGRNPQLKTVWTRQLEAARAGGCTPATLESWSVALKECLVDNKDLYPPEAVWNFDESGFAVGASQSTRALINCREATKFKTVSGRQEWITAVECINAEGSSIPPMIVYRAAKLHDGWVPQELGTVGWYWTTSNKGWINNTLGYEWLTKVFDHYTIRRDPTTNEIKPRLLICDGHASHVTSHSIRFCIDNNIRLMVLPPHTSHLLQPLDVAVFAPLKAALAKETDALARLTDGSRSSKQEWVRCYARARGKAFTSSNIKSGFRGSGIWPWRPTIMRRALDQVREESVEAPVEVNESFSSEALFNSSPPEATILHEANLVLGEHIDDSSMVAQAKRYNRRVIDMLEQQAATNSLLRRENEKLKALLSTRSTMKTGKRVALKGQLVFSTETIFTTANQYEERTNAKKKGKRVPKKRNSTAKTVEVENPEPPEPIEQFLGSWQMGK